MPTITRHTWITIGASPAIRCLRHRHLETDAECRSIQICLGNLRILVTVVKRSGRSGVRSRFVIEQDHILAPVDLSSKAIGPSLAIVQIVFREQLVGRYHTLSPFIAVWLTNS